MSNSNETLPPRRRAADRPDPSDKWFKLLAVVGAVVLLVVIVLEITAAVLRGFYGRSVIVEIPHVVMYLAGLLGFVGFYGLNPRKAREGGDFIVSASERIIAVVRTGKGLVGRRSSDAIVMPPGPSITTSAIAPDPAETAETEIPMDLPTRRDD